MFRGLETIKVDTVAESIYYQDRDKLKRIAEASLFHIAYGDGVGISLSRSWERSYFRLKRRSQVQVQFPRRVYNSELVSYYQLAISGESLILSYLSLYKIVEYFYTRVSEETLHNEIIQQLVKPEFSHTESSHIRAMVRLIRDHDNRMKEVNQLKTLLSRYFTSDEIKAWVHAYEKSTRQYYTSPQDVFGEQLTIDLNPAKFASSLAKRIYHIRNVLVHNKESESSRFLPFSGQEAVLSEEIHILLFLSEQLILKTGEDL